MSVGINQSVYRPPEFSEAKFDQEFADKWQRYQAIKAEQTQEQYGRIFCRRVIGFYGCVGAAVIAFIYWYGPICDFWGRIWGIR